MKERAQDERILAAIIAGAHDERVSLARGSFGVRYYKATLPSGPSCAVGCGLLYRNVACIADNAITAFAEHYGVSRDYAIGVSNGFEGYAEHYRYYPPHSDYARGWAVGCAAATLLDDVGESW